MPDSNSGGWPRAYDFDELKRTIRELREEPHLEKWFFSQPDPNHPPFCQGDVIRLPSKNLYINQDGEPAAGEVQEVWMVLGNSCDLERSVDEVPWTQLIPITSFSLTEAESELADLRAYRAFKLFFVPDWTSGSTGYVANFLRPVTAHRLSLDGADLVARLSFRGWVLFYSCLVRYLARPDGRFASE